MLLIKLNPSSIGRLALVPSQALKVRRDCAFPQPANGQEAAEEQPASIELRR
jgi:hypothetical protein